MSLSFVSKSVLTQKEGGDGYEEKDIESKDSGAAGTSSSRASYNSQPLFEQLRANKEKEESERDEFQRSIMRGTLALDEEDCAHLDAIQRSKHERDQLVQQQTNDEVAAFRAARELRQLEQQHQDDDDDDDEEEDNKEKSTTMAATITTSKPTNKFPQIIVKKKKRQATTTTTTTTATNAKTTTKKEPQAKKPKTSSEETKPTTTSGGLGGLFAGYGSDSDDDSD